MSELPLTRYGFELGQIYSQMDKLQIESAYQ